MKTLTSILVVLFALNSYSMGFDAQKNKELFYLLFAEPTNTIADFSTDGCSSFPNGRHFGTKKEWIHCCYIHDVDYWYGGPEDLKKKADEELNKCVSKAQSESLGFIMDVGVTIGGKPGLTSWRWAYGWNYLIKYESLNEEQEKSLSSKIITVAETFLKLKDGLTYPQRMAIYQRLYLLGLENSHNLKQEELDQYNERISKLTLFEL